MSTDCTIRVEMFPASAMAAVATGENVAAKGFIPKTLQAGRGDSREENLRNDYAIWGAYPDCPAEVGVKVECWLIGKRGSELPKSKEHRSGSAGSFHGFLLMEIGSRASKS